MSRGLDDQSIRGVFTFAHNSTYRAINVTILYHVTSTYRLHFINERNFARIDNLAGKIRDRRNNFSSFAGGEKFDKIPPQLRSPRTCPLTNY